MAFGFSLPKLPTQALVGDGSGDPTASPTSVMGGASGLSMPDKLMMFGAILKGHPDLAMQIPMMAQARRAFAAQQAATNDLATAVSGQHAPIPSRAALVKAADPANADTVAPDGSYTGAGDGGVTAAGVTIPTLNIPRSPAADAVSGPPTVRAALPMLARLAKTGGNIEPWTKLLDAAQPKATVVNGRVLDEHDPSIYGGYYGEAPAKGAEPVYDANGKQVGWHMADGAIQAIQGAANAEARGQQAAQAEFAGPIERAKQSAQADFAGPIAAGTAAGKAAVEDPHTLETHDLNGVPTTMTRQQWLTLSGGGAPAPASAAPAAAHSAPAALPISGGKLDPQGFYKFFTLKHEGGLNASDLNGAPTMYGFNQTANPDIDVKTLTPDTAAQRFERKYYVPSGAANMPPALGAVHADTYFINPSVAQHILQQSGGDPSKYMDLREAWLNHLVQTQPGAAKYEKAWATRNADLRQFAQQAASSSPDAAAAPANTAPAATPGFHGVNPADQKKVDAYMDDAHAAEDVSQKAHQFQDLNKKTFTGPLFNPVRIHVPLVGEVPLNPISGIGSAFQPGSQAMDNLSMQMATGLRAPGQRLTQAEIFQNLKTVPRRGSLPASNDASADVIDSRAATKRAYANFMSDWLSRTGTLNGADAAWARQQGAGGQGDGSASAKAPAAPMKARPMQQIRLKSGGTATVVQVQ